MSKNVFKIMRECLKLIPSDFVLDFAAVLSGGRLVETSGSGHTTGRFVVGDGRFCRNWFPTLLLV